MYEDDTPAAERRAQALSLDRDLLRELLGQEELRDLIDPGALEDVEEQLRGERALARRAARPAAPPRRPARGRVPERPGRAAAGRAPRRPRPRRGRAAPDRGRGRRALPRRRRRDAAGRAARGLPRGRRGAAALAACAASRARAGRSRPREANERFGRDVEPVLRELERRDELVRGELRPGGTEREWCDPEVLRRLRRASLAALRREVEPAEQAALRALPAELARHRPPRVAARSARASAGPRAAGCALGERRAAPARSRLPAGAARRALRLGRGRLGRRRARPRRALLPRGRARARARRPRPTGPEQEIHERLRAALGRSALFWHDLLARHRARGRGGAARALGSRLGGRGHERRLDAAARRPALRDAGGSGLGRGASRAGAPAR